MNNLSTHNGAEMDFKHESITDIPLIIEFCKRLNLQGVIDQNIKMHGNQQGLSNGQIASVWLAHILTQNNHCKSPVQEWVNAHKMTLQSLIGCQISELDFEDCRLGRFLEKFANNVTWHNIEKSFYNDSCSVLQLDINPPKHFQDKPSIKSEISKTIKIDATTAYGHHEILDNEIMQRGWSKDHRPDLPQLKIMVSVEGNTGLQIASEILPGNENDDPHYIPVLERTRNIVETIGCLMCGDSKMSNLATRANIVKNKEFYLTPLQLTNSHKVLLSDLVEKAVNGSQISNLIFDYDDKNKKKILGAGFEVDRILSYKDEVNKLDLEWTERVLLIRSFDHAEKEIRQFKKRLKKTIEELLKCESKLFSNIEDAEKELLEKIESKLSKSDFKSLLNIKTETILEEKERKRGERKDNGEIRKGTYKLKKYRTRVVSLTENEEILKEFYHKMGWRMYVTNANKSSLNFSSAYNFFRKTMYVIEIGFHVLKDYINISPLYVREPNQILGMTRFLMLALKILTLMTAEVRANMKKENIVLEGLYAGQKARKHPSPTAQSLLQYFSRKCIALVGHKIGEKWIWRVSPLPDTCRQVLKLLKIPENTYDKLGEIVSSMGY